ncbi:nickel-dependent lactate racemase [Eggerthella sp. YY7918]|uniref:nickel-dependent lactate racemase n=1 Tax=Eggerthella sp. (strain YY7918) TaxID=502558 RepID=UPI00021713C0|nr:nickel-dependent lactate racemase [Eggerthella sp. YY7918]BAK44260.1 hypothetical protein EGYY_10820 [Eggerthella sp. YY7918]
MKIEVGYGTGTQAVEVPDEKILGVLAPNKVEKGLTGVDEVRRALAEPIGTPRLRDIVRPGERIAIITSDITRPVPTYTIMPALLDELYEAGVTPSDITLVFALGSHRPHTEEEQRHLAGERAWAEITCIDGDPSTCVHVGETTAGTPVDIVEVVAKADRRICLGNIEYHYFAGYSGGAKAIMPGVSTREAIQANHTKMVDPRACAGNLDDNPVRQDIEEAAAMVGCDFLLNVVLDEHKQIVKAVAGDLVQAHREGCRFLDSLYRVEVPCAADIIIVSQGGAPKDLNLYQTQKALDNAKHVIADDGVIILVGSCVEGLGNTTFEEWMTAAQSPADLVERIKRDFKLGGHKAAAIALVMQRADIYLVSEMDPAFVESLFFTPFATLEEAYAAALRKKGPEARVLAMPYGGSTLPMLAK